MDIKAYFNKKNRLIDGFIETHFNERLAPSIFKDSIVYSLSAGGKRLRPILCLAAYEACGGSGDEIVPYASALEFIHTYSLIHDDLPAMDNDDVRRGKPTNHKVFGEGMAILAGDALLTEAFYLISGEESRISANHLPHAVLLRVIHELSRASGMHGMVKGQAQDLLSENSEPDAAILESIHLHKTAALITASVRIGGILAGCSEEALIRLTQYGKNIGLAFQVVDDILDVEGETETIGKPRGSDDKKKKMTYPRLYGIGESKKKAGEFIDAAIESLSDFDERAEPLREIAAYLLNRKS